MENIDTLVIISILFIIFLIIIGIYLYFTFRPKISQPIKSNTTTSLPIKSNTTSLPIKSNTTIQPHQFPILNKNTRILNLAWSNTGSHALTKPSGQKVIHLDGFDATKEDVANYKKKGYIVTAYLSIGSWENWRPDKDDFPKETIGKKYDGWAGEKWLNCSAGVWPLLKPVMTKRFQMIKDKGFDGFELDNTELFHHDPKATYADGLAYNKWIADTAHKMGLLVFWKNSLDMIKDIVDDFDAIINEEALHFNETENLKMFYDKNKPVWVFEYKPLKNPNFPNYLSDVYLDVKGQGWVRQIDSK